MLLAEVLVRKDYIGHKIIELKNSLFSSSIDKENRDDIKEHLFSLMDDYQRHVILINKVNNATNVKVGKSTISLTNAVTIRDTVKEKMDVLSSVIETNRVSETLNYNIIELINQRDQLMEEYMILSSAIYSQDWKMEIKQ